MKYSELKRTDVERMDKTHKVVVVPLGSIEQHGQHLPLGTDSLIGEELATRVEAALPETVLLMPTQWLGSSHHHLKFPGTVSVPSSLYIELVYHLGECLLSAGFTRIFLLVSHGGNDVPCREALNRLALAHRERTDFWIVSGCYWLIAEDAMRLPRMETARATHACEYETSMVLSLRPELVAMDQAVGDCLSVGSRYYCPDGSGPSRVQVNLPFEQMTRTGAMGRPDLGSASKGDELLRGITDQVVDFVREFSRWQHRRDVTRDSQATAADSHSAGDPR